MALLLTPVLELLKRPESLLDRISYESFWQEMDTVRLDMAGMEQTQRQAYQREYEKAIAQDISLMARDDMGTRRCLLPLPSTLMKPSSKYRSEIFRLHSSDTRRPQLYRVSRMARLRCPSFVPWSMAEMIRSISSTVSTSGR